MSFHRVRVSLWNLVRKFRFVIRAQEGGVKRQVWELGFWVV